MAKIDVPMSEEWSTCAHEWEEVDGWAMDPDRIDVACKKCGVPGEQWIKSGEVDWPTT